MPQNMNDSFATTEISPTTARRLDYVYAEGRVVAVHVDEGGSESVYNVLTDHLGSWECTLP